MRHALRRILWIVPMLFAASILTFWALARVSPSLPATAAPAAAGLDHEALHPFPLFFNPEPRSVRTLTERAVDSIARQDADAPASASLLARLGGAALPFVLPQLDSLAPTERSRVALALAPIGERMRVGSPIELHDAEAAVLFWNRFWEDRSIDFRPAVVKRSVRRLAARSTIGRREDIMQLDTFALPELMNAWGGVATAEDVARARRISALASHVTGHDWTIPKHASAEDARVVVAQWRRWWRLHGADYESFDGPRRLTAMVLETAYGKWLSTVTDGSLGTTVTGRPVLEVFRERVPVTAWLVTAALVGGYLVALILGMLGAARPRSALDLLMGAAAVVAVALPIGLLARWLAPDASPSGALTGAASLLLVTTAALVSRYQRTAAEPALQDEHCRTLRAMGASPFRTAAHAARNSSTVAVSLVGVHLPTLLTAVFVLEYAFALPGLGPATLAAVEQRDVAWLMATALGTLLTVSLAQAASDAVLSALDPRIGALFALGRRARE